MSEKTPDYSLDLDIKLGDHIVRHTLRWRDLIPGADPRILHATVSVILERLFREWISPRTEIEAQERRRCQRLTAFIQTKPDLMREYENWVRTHG